jgi:hypothetical protein
MLQVANFSLLQCTLGVFANPDGVECAYGVAKATFDVDPAGRVALAKTPVPFVMADEHYGDPAQSSIKATGELTLIKPATDVVMVGHAYAPGGRADACDVSLRVGPVGKVVRVFGDRVWQRGMIGVGYRPSVPQPFERVPLTYELAFGGTDPEPTDENKVDYEPRNPIGRGLVPRRSNLKPPGLPLPNLEDPANLIRGANDRPVPAGFGPICAHWSPRKELVGTYEENWARTRAPYLPDDFNPRHLQVAHPDLIAPGYLRGGEPVEIMNASPGGRLRFDLPACDLELTFHLDGKPHVHVPNLDTVIIEPDAGRFHMLWRACQVVDKKLLRLSRLDLACKQYPKRSAA